MRMQGSTEGRQGSMVHMRDHCWVEGTGGLGRELMYTTMGAREA